MIKQLDLVFGPGSTYESVNAHAIISNADNSNTTYTVQPGLSRHIALAILCHDLLKHDWTTLKIEAS